MCVKEEGGIATPASLHCQPTTRFIINHRILWNSHRDIAHQRWFVATDRICEIVFGGARIIQICYLQSDPGAEATYVRAMPNCNLPYHWPRLDKEQILCLRIANVPGCMWSGGFMVNNNAFHINVRCV